MSDPIKVMSLLERRNHRWGDKNLMELSHIGHLRSFIASKQSITESGVREIYCVAITFYSMFCRQQLYASDQYRMEERVPQITK